jgi:alginate O-acetyltransferase complex protein AlgJ
MYRDSYANYLIPFLNQHFKDATYIWSYEFTPSLIEELKPDVVIFETLQRFMPYAFLTLNPL